MTKEVATHSQIPFLADLVHGLYFGFQALRYVNTHPNPKIFHETAKEFFASGNWGDEAIRMHIVNNYGPFEDHPTA